MNNVTYKNKTAEPLKKNSTAEMELVVKDV